MGKWCKVCGKTMKDQELTHCSDECLLVDVKKSESRSKEGEGAESWEDESDPWK